MAKNDNNNNNNEFPKKWAKHLPGGFSDTIESADEAEIKKTIVESQQTISDVERDMDADERLAVLKSDVKDIAGAYKDVLRAHEAKMRYCVYVLRQRGNA